MRNRLLVAMACVVFVGLLSSVSMADLTEGLVGYWPLDGDATDMSGNGLDGTINGNVTMTEDRNGNADSAMLFPGEQNSHVAIEDDPIPRWKASTTVEFSPNRRVAEPDHGI